MDWSTELGRKAREHIESERVIWLTTTGPDWTPHPRPVWFVWDQESFLIYSRPNRGKVAHIPVHPLVSLNFNTDAASGDEDVITFLGEARIVNDAPPAHQQTAYFEKYREAIRALKMTPEEYGATYSIAIRVTPTRLWGW